MSLGVMTDYKVHMSVLHTSYTVTGLCVGLEQPKTETRLTNEKFASVKGEYEI